MQLSSLAGHNSFQLSTALSLHLDLLLSDVGLSLPVLSLTLERQLVILDLGHIALHVLASHFKVVGEGAVAVHVSEDGFTFVTRFVDHTVC